MGGGGLLVSVGRKFVNFFFVFGIKGMPAGSVHFLKDFSRLF